MSYLHFTGVGGGSGRRPTPHPHVPIGPPFDPSDDYGQVHTDLPPEQIIPPHFTDPAWMRADFNGMTLDLTRWGTDLPFLSGANSTPLAMLMTPMLALYPRKWQDACLTEHAERGYDDFVIALPQPWNAEENGRSLSTQDTIEWLSYVKSWGFRIVGWRSGRPPAQVEDLTKILLDSNLLDWFINGKEVDQQMIAEDFEESLRAIDTYIGGRIPIGAHFSADPMPPNGRGMGYPIGFPRDTFMTSWAPYDGRVHLMMQMCVDAPAGLQGANMYYARRRINCGMGDGAGPGAPNSRIIAFETMATAQLYGQCDESYGCLRNWELLCGPRADTCALPVSGFGNGGCYPSGAVL